MHGLAVGLGACILSPVLQLSFFWFLLTRSTFMGVGLIVPILTAQVLLRADRHRSWRLLILPAMWLVPLGLGGLFAVPGETRTAVWVGYVAGAMLLVFPLAVAWCIAALPHARRLALAHAALNAPMILLSAVVLGMAAGGTWL